MDSILASYTRGFVDSSSWNDYQRSDEIQFAAALTLAYISRTFHPTDEKRLSKVIDILQTGIESRYLSNYFILFFNFLKRDLTFKVVSSMRLVVLLDFLLFYTALLHRRPLSFI
jgi:hypothetical protein